MMMNDFFFPILMRQRHEQITDEVDAARAWQLEGQRKICRIRHRLPAFLKESEIPISNQVPIANERNSAWGGQR
jgi:hypothetical protein